jgi:hypothetical protein
MVDVHVEAHADGVGGHEVVDLAGLVQRDLGVAGARAERAHHHRRAAALAADQLGDGVDLVGREPTTAERGAGGSASSRRYRQGWRTAAADDLEARAAARFITARIVSAAPSSMVSFGPRACSSRSVKTWPRSGSAQSWISSIARKATGGRAASPRRCRRNSAPFRHDLLLAGDQRDLGGPAA